MFIVALGERINLQKFRLICCKSVAPVVKIVLSEILHIPIWDTPAKYFGISTQRGNSKSQALQWIKERVFSKLEG